MFVLVALASIPSWMISCLPNDLTWQELQSVRRGMTPDEVRDLIGRPDRVVELPDGRIDWLYGGLFADTVTFQNNRVVDAFRF
jgi:hypothetical protein